MTPLERAAKAAFDTMSKGAQGAQWESLTEPAKVRMCDLVRAVLTALMEPTPEMLQDVGMMAGFDYDVFAATADECHEEWWQAMLGKVLEG